MCIQVAHRAFVSHRLFTADWSIVLPALDAGNATCIYTTTVADSGLDTTACPGNVRADEGLDFPRLYVQAVCDCAGGIATEDGSTSGSPGSCQCPCKNAQKVASVPLYIEATVLTLNAAFQGISPDWVFDSASAPDVLLEQRVALSATFSAS